MHMGLNIRDLCKVRSDALLSVIQKQTAAYKDSYGTIYTQVSYTISNIKIGGKIDYKKRKKSGY